MFGSHSVATCSLRRELFVGLAAISGTLIASPGVAGDVGGGSPVFALHVTTHTNKPCNASVNPQTIDCTSYTVSAPINANYDIYLVMAGIDTSMYDGVKGASCGITYNGAAGQGVDVFAWSSCTTLEFPNGSPEWPASGGGNLVTWDTCQDTVTVSGVQATLGAFYVYAYSDDSFQVTPNLNVAFEELSWADCAGEKHILVNFEYLARADFGAGTAHAVHPGQGCNPCLEPCGWGDPVVPTTWGFVKTRYGE